MYCKYYQALAERKMTWFVSGALRNEEHMAFDRSLDKKTNLLEFFVAPLCEKKFLSLMSYLKQKGYIKEFKELPNRLEKQQSF